MLTVCFSFRVSEKSQATSSLLWTSSAGCLWTSSEWFVVAACMRRNGLFQSSIILRVTVAWKIWASPTSQVRRHCIKLRGKHMTDVTSSFQWWIICPEHDMSCSMPLQKQKLNYQQNVHWLWMVRRRNQIYMEVSFGHLDHNCFLKSFLSVDHLWSCAAIFSKQMDVTACLIKSKFVIGDLQKCVGVFRNLAHLHSVALTHPFHSTEQNAIQTGP